MKGDKVDSISVTTLKRVGPDTRELLANFNIRTIQDLLFHLPLHYQDRTRLTPIADVRRGNQVVIEGKIQRASVIYMRRRNLICRISDGTGSLLLRFYHFNLKQKEQLTKVGLMLRCFGSVRKNYQGRLEMGHPEYRIMDERASLVLEDCLTPVYPTTRGLRQTQWRYLMAQALEYLKKTDSIEELLPEPLRKSFQLPTIAEALVYVHRPPQGGPISLLQSRKHPAQQRLAFEELLAQQAGLQRLRLRTKTHCAPILESKINWQAKLREALPFQLTTAQQHVIEEINRDLSMPNPMLRLVQGDVGSGKTVVAAMSAIKAVENSYQSVIMAPTELLAEQHYRAFQKWLEPLGINVGLLTGSLNNAVREETLRKITSGEYQVVVGTHALFQEAVIFRNLALVIIDEQHRFGVHQRLALKEKGLTKNDHPHQLIMTATPIPRTLAMTAYADLDVSIIDELPIGRKPITTAIISNTRREKVIEGIKKICEQGKQAYWVCILIKESETLQCKTAEAIYKSCQKLLTNLKIGLIHRRLNKNEQEAVMAAFKVGKIDLLVATTVIEVGVDVPNANLMIIENAERLGLAQMHQLRGRIGRGEDKGYCILLYQGPLSNNARNRLSLLRDSQDGFFIAQKDLELRGAGELFGTRQAGLFRFRIADMARDIHLLPSVQKMSNLILQHYPHIIDRLLTRWLKRAEIYWDV